VIKQKRVPELTPEYPNCLMRTPDPEPLAPIPLLSCRGEKRTDQGAREGGTPRRMQHTLRGSDENDCHPAARRCEYHKARGRSQPEAYVVYVEDWRRPRTQ